jgi:dienelactone hydrolase
MTASKNLLAALAFLLSTGCQTQLQASPAIGQEVFSPASPGPIVLVLSGASGPEFYREYASRVASLGYYTVLLDGRDVLSREKDGLGNLRGAIAAAQGAAGALPGKAAVIGFSQGGGGAILHASTLRDQVSMVVAYYPAVSWSPSMEWLASRIQLPVLILAGEKDHYNACCLVESMRGLESAARARKAPLELVVYPQAEHAFTLNLGNYRTEDAEDAWRRTRAMLARYQPLKHGE